MWLARSRGSSVWASPCRFTMTPMPSLVGIGTSPSTLPKQPETKLPGHGVLYIHCTDADRVAEEWRQAGVEVDGPRDEDYGKREGSPPTLTATWSALAVPSAEVLPNRVRCDGGAAELPTTRSQTADD